MEEDAGEFGPELDGLEEPDEASDGLKIREGAPPI